MSDILGHDCNGRPLREMHAIAEFREARNPSVIAAGRLLEKLERP